MTRAEALELGTLHGARCLGRDDELGTLEVGKLADIVLWRLDDLDHAGHRRPGGRAGARARGRWPSTVMVAGGSWSPAGSCSPATWSRSRANLSEVALR